MKCVIFDSFVTEGEIFNFKKKVEEKIPKRFLEKIKQENIYIGSN